MSAPVTMSKTPGCFRAASISISQIRHAPVGAQKVCAGLTVDVVVGRVPPAARNPPEVFTTPFELMFRPKSHPHPRRLSCRDAASNTSGACVNRSQGRARLRWRQDDAKDDAKSGSPRLLLANEMMDGLPSRSCEAAQAGGARQGSNLGTPSMSRRCFFRLSYAPVQADFVLRLWRIEASRPEIRPPPASSGPRWTRSRR